MFIFNMLDWLQHPSDLNIRGRSQRIVTFLLTRTFVGDNISILWEWISATCELEALGAFKDLTMSVFGETRNLGGVFP